MALDSSRNQLYFTSTDPGAVGVLSTDGPGGKAHLLIAGDNEKPTAIAVDSLNRHFAYCNNEYVLLMHGAAVVGYEQGQLIHSVSSLGHF